MRFMTENLLCAYCLIDDQTKTPAVTLMDGTALCESHAPEITARADEEKKRKEDLIRRAASR